MVEPGEARLTRDLSLDITENMVALWTRYAGRGPTSAYTGIRGNTVTISLVDAVANFEERIPQPKTDVARAMTLESYKREAVATVGRLTRQRVASLTSTHDRKTDIATEVFQLQESRVNGQAPSRENPAGGSGRRARLHKPARGGTRY